MLDRLLERKLVFEDFADKVGQVFAIPVEGAPALALILKDAVLLDAKMALPNAPRPPFALLFHGPLGQELGQGLYRLENEALNEMVLFLVPVGKDAAAMHYQATFN